MKKILAILLCAALAVMGAAALAENPFDDLFGNLPGEPGNDTPPRGDIEAGDGITLEVDGESVHLAYDASPQYSSIQGGTVQASYYAYGADSKTLYELYITFPDTARAGMIITPEYASLTGEESSVVLIVSRDGVETYYFLRAGRQRLPRRLRLQHRHRERQRRGRHGRLRRHAVRQPDRPGHVVRRRGRDAGDPVHPLPLHHLRAAVLPPPQRARGHTGAGGPEKGVSCGTPQSRCARQLPFQGSLDKQTRLPCVTAS